MTIVQPVKGTRDFYPEDMAVRKWLYKNIQYVSELFGFQEYEGPMLETIALYAAKSGEELVKENFAFPDKGGDMITLRPELTPSLARMITQRQRQLIYPLKWWSYGPFWRYERPQKGRGREFFQWNIDIIGTDSIIAEAELATIGASFFSLAGLHPNQVNILVNDRSLIDQELGELEIEPHIRPGVLRLIDRQDKMANDEWRAFALEIGLTEGQFNGVQVILSNKELWKKSADLRKFFEDIQAYGMSEWFRYAPNIIRGLDYYTRIVMEAWDKDGEFRSILGGGRYDNLVKDLGGDPLSGVGFAMGDLTTSLVLKKFDCIPKEITEPTAKVLVTIFNEETSAESLGFASELRKTGIHVSCYPEASKIAKQFKYGDRMGYLLAVVIGPDEIANHKVTIKNLKTGDQETLERMTAPIKIRTILNNVVGN